MLTITQSAIDVVNQVAPGDAGLRIFVDVDCARVFLEPAAAEALEEMVLDAATEGDTVRFAVAPQGEQGMQS